MSLDAVNTLRKHGYNARRLADGFPEWQAEGHPVENGENSTDRGNRKK
jgi:rhodanese-related sulfurtransferase